MPDITLQSKNVFFSRNIHFFFFSPWFWPEEIDEHVPYDRLVMAGTINYYIVPAHSCSPKPYVLSVCLSVQFHIKKKLNIKKSSFTPWCAESSNIQKIYILYLLVSYEWNKKAKMGANQNINLCWHHSDPPLFTTFRCRRDDSVDSSRSSGVFSSS